MATSLSNPQRYETESNVFFFFFFFFCFFFFFFFFFPRLSSPAMTRWCTSKSCDEDRDPGMKAFHIVSKVNICGRGGRDGDNLFGCSEVSFADFTQRGAAVTEVTYQASLEHLKEEIRCWKSLTSCVLLLHDGARPHTALLDTC
jgi:hypothetical protein